MDELYGAVLLVLLLMTMLVCTVFLLPTSADKAAEVRLLGKWGIYMPEANVALPPDRIIEFLPHGDVANYSASLELLSDDSASRCSWYIRRGNFIMTIEPGNELNRRYVDQAPITWIDDDNIILTMTVPSGQLTPIRYRRLGVDELKKLQAN